MRSIALLAALACCASQPSHAAEPPRGFSAGIELRLALAAPAPDHAAAKVGSTDETVYLAPTAIVTGRDLDRVGLVKEDAFPLRLEMTFNKAAGEKLAAASAANIGRRLAIVSAGKVLSAPTLRSPISTEVALSGNFTKAELVEILAAFIEE
jgi:preprotein translocase subunit SecD